jgi:hypothetical protein
MTARLVGSAIVAGLLVGGAVAAQDGSGLPSKGGHVTVVGCVQPGLKHRLVLVSPTTAPVDAVPQSECSLPIAEPLLELHDTHEYHFDNALVGHWVEITGRVEHFDKHDDAKNPRELHIRQFRSVPVAPPRVAEVPMTREMPPPIAAPAAPAPAAEKPIATTGTTPAPAPLPNTASPLPLVLATMVMAFMGALALRLLRGRVAGLY